jgi:transposase
MAPVRPVDERQPNRQVLLLFYAGMGNDKAAEHIGLARSTDGRTFQRVAPDGLAPARHRHGRRQ